MLKIMQISLGILKTWTAKQSGLVFLAHPLYASVHQAV